MVVCPSSPPLAPPLTLRPQARNNSALLATLRRLLEDLHLPDATRTTLESPPFDRPKKWVGAAPGTAALLKPSGIASFSVTTKVQCFLNHVAPDPLPCRQTVRGFDLSWCQQLQRVAHGRCLSFCFQALRHFLYLTVHSVRAGVLGTHFFLPCRRLRAICKAAWSLHARLERLRLGAPGALPAPMLLMRVVRDTRDELSGLASRFVVRAQC